MCVCVHSHVRLTAGSGGTELPCGSGLIVLLPVAVRAAAASTSVCRLAGNTHPSACEQGGRERRSGWRQSRAERRKEAKEPYSLHTVWKLSSSDGRAWPAPCQCSLPASASAPPPQPHSPPPMDPPPVHQDAERLLHQTFKNAAISWLLRSLQGEQGRSIKRILASDCRT